MEALSGRFVRGLPDRMLLRGGSLDNWGPRETPRGPSSLRRLRLMEGRDCAAVWVSANSPLRVTMKSRSLKCTCAPGAQLIEWVAIRGLIWNTQAPYLACQLSVFRTSTGK